MVYLAIDLGDKRTGLAVGDDESRLVSPLRVVETGHDHVRLDAIARVIDGHAPQALVVGLPVNMDGSEGPAAKKARAFADQLAQRFNLPVHFMDERLTSFAADNAMAGSGLTRGQKRARRDALAAAAILRDFFEQPTDGDETRRRGGTE
jgi:putative pre-16S rRNA nuclease